MGEFLAFLLMASPRQNGPPGVANCEHWRCRFVQLALAGELIAAALPRLR
jgi:hypothetical protein